MLNKVYVIDDDEMSLYITKIILEHYAPQSQCTCFEDAQQALDQLKEDIQQDGLPSLILLDLNMPYMNGLEFLEAIKPWSGALENKCFICLLTSSVDEQDLLRSLASGLVLDYIQKPITQEKLEEISKLYSGRT